MKQVVHVLLVCASLMLVIPPVQAVADSNPVQLALFDPIQIVPAENSIGGVRLSIYGKNTSVVGLDLGIVNISTGGTSKGIQFGGIGINDGNFTGWQDNLVSISRGTMTGLQTGVYTQAGHMSGLQFGLLNFADTMNGLQIGLLNFISKGGFMPFFPIVNWSFE